MRRLIKLVFFIIFFGLALFSTKAQERIYIDKKEFKQTEDGFKEAWSNIKTANFLFYQHREGSYRKAIEYYEKALAYNSENPELNLLIGICYLRSWPKEYAMKHIEKAIDSRLNIHPKAQFLLGKAYQYSGEFNKAIIAYNAYLDELSPNQKAAFGDIINKYISECENGLVLKKKQVRALIDNMGPQINSKYDDYDPVLSEDGTILAFTSRRGEEGDMVSQVDHKFFEDIYLSKKAGNKWELATNIGSPLNTKWNDAAVSLSEDGKKLVLYRGRTDGGDLYSATLKGNKWGNIHDLTNKVNKDNSQESSVCFNIEGTRMYFVSNREKDSYGGRDIFMSQIDAKGKKWSKPINLGPVINTPYDEISVYVSPDELTIYFSSNGHKNIGGFDIFKSEFKDSTWTEPENLGMPINTTGDDMYLKILPNERDAYYTSSCQGGEGGLDIYHLILLGPEKPLVLANEDNLIACLAIPEKESFIEEAVEIQYTRMTVVKGIVTDFNTGRPIEATIELVDNATGKTVKETKSNINTGSYLITLPSGKNYGFSVNADNYMFHSENFVVPEASGYREIFKDVALQPMSAGSKIILYNTFFESGKSNLRPESFSELNRVARMFTKYPNLVLEISGHTDSRGSVAVNKRISKARAKAVVDYLVGQGVNPANLQSVGYYFKYPVASNKTEEGRQQNRRVEAKIISN
ncbi:MAG: OmpA family protein [Bacteroidales bacterium]|nr:OmpA family protein [Bacteroidales bacterium]